MEIGGRSLTDRITQTIVVFAVFAVFNLVQDAYSWISVFLIPIFFFVMVLVIDVARNRLIV